MATRAPWHLLPTSASSDARRLVIAKMLRAFADGMVSVLLPVYLTVQGFSTLEIGAVVTATLLGSAVVTLLVGLLAHRFQTERVLLFACGLMALTGLGFAWTRDFYWVLAVAFVGTLNPSAGDVSLFLPLEQSLLARSASGHDLPTLYARSNVAAAAMGGLGALCSAYPTLLSRYGSFDEAQILRMGFFVYAALALLALTQYAGLSVQPRRTSEGHSVPLKRSRRIVFELSVLFTLDSFGGGFVVQSLLALWFFQRFHFTLADAAGFFFATSLLSGASQLLSPVFARRFGLIPTMVFTHIPANAFLVAAAFMPNAWLSITCLLLRMAFASMDVPARQAFVMGVVPPEERAAAAAVTNVPRSLGTGLAPVFAGYLLSQSDFGYPLVIGGALKIAYDLLLLRSYRHHAVNL